MVYRTRCFLEISFRVTIVSSRARDLGLSSLLAIVTTGANDGFCGAFRAVLSCWTSETIIDGCGTVPVEVSSWWASIRHSRSLSTIVAGRALTQRQVSDRVVVALVAFWAHLALIHEDTLVPARVSAWWALVHISVVYEFVAEDRAPHALRARIEVIAAPLANPSGLTASTVSDLTLSRLHTHGLEWASDHRESTLWTVESWIALANRGVRYRVKAFIADVTSNTFVDLDTCTAVVSLRADLA